MRITSPVKSLLVRAERGDLDGSDEISVKVDIERDRLEEGIEHLSSVGGSVESTLGQFVFATVRIEDVLAVADSSAVVLIHLDDGMDLDDSPLETREVIELFEDEEEPEPSDGTAETGAVDAHLVGVTGEGVTVAVIDSEFDLENEVYADQVVETIGEEGMHGPDAEEGLHGTNSAEVVARMAPGADLVLASTVGDLRTQDILEQLEHPDDHGLAFDHVDVVTHSQRVFPTAGLPIDGEDSLSEAIGEFTEDGRLFVTSASNKANGHHWDGQFPAREEEEIPVDETDPDRLEFDDEGTERLEILRPLRGQDFCAIVGALAEEFDLLEDADDDRDDWEGFDCFESDDEGIEEVIEVFRIAVHDDDRSRPLLEDVEPAVDLLALRHDTDADVDAIVTEVTQGVRGSDGRVWVYWDEGWEDGGGNYIVRLFDAPEGGTLLDDSWTGRPYETVNVEEYYAERVYLEIERTGGPGGHHFDVFVNRRLALSTWTSERSLTIPATSRDPNTLAVAAVDVHEDLLAHYSSRGPTQYGADGVDLAGPTHVELSQDEYGGTSAATPFVAGAAALLLSTDANPTVEEVRDALFENARGISNLFLPERPNPYVGHGFISVTDAVETFETVELAIGGTVRAINTHSTRVNQGLRYPKGSEGLLDTVPVPARAFYHGERTADLGRLGTDTVVDGGDDLEPDDGRTLRVDLDLTLLADDAYAHVDVDPVDIETFRWRLVHGWYGSAAGAGEADLPGADDDEGENGDDASGTDSSATDRDSGSFEVGFVAAELEQSRTDHESDGLVVRDVVPGPWRLEVDVLDDGDDLLDTWKIPLSVPRHVPVHCDTDLVADVLDAVGDGGAPADLWRSNDGTGILDVTRRVASHVLRPLNVRLEFDPETDDGDADENVLSTATDDAVRVALEWVYPSTAVAIGPPGDPVETLFDDVDDGESHERSVEGEEAWYGRRYWTYPDGVPRDTWAVSAGLGAFDASGDAVGDPTAVDEPTVDEVLAYAGDAADEADFDPDADETSLWIELCGRALGVSLARAVALSVVDPAPEAERDGRPGVDVTDPAPEEPLRQLLGLHRPDGTDVTAIVDDISDGQLEAPADHGLRESWTDLVAYYERIWCLDEPTTAAYLEHPVGRRYAGYDVLAGVVLESTLEDARDRLPLGPPYGGGLTYGDRDGDWQLDGQPRYGGETRAVTAVDDGRRVGNLQYDLDRTGFSLGFEPANAEGEPGIGRFGYRRVTTDDGMWDGETATDGPATLTDDEERHRLVAGHTAMSVREFRIADAYPNRVYEPLDGQPDGDRVADGVVHRNPGETDPGDGTGVVDEHRHRYGDGFTVLEGAGPPEPAVSATSSTPTFDGSMVGELDLETALELRRWRFAGRRNPVVVQVCDDHDEPETVHAERVQASRGWTSEAESAVVRDHSGYFDPDAEQAEWEPLGRYYHYGTLESGEWGGPGRPQARTTERIDREVDRDHLLGDVLEGDGSDAHERVYRVVADAVTPERTRFDAATSYDEFVSSVSLSGLEVARADDDAPAAAEGQLAAFVRFLAAVDAGVDDVLLEGIDDESVEALREIHEFAFGFFGTTASDLELADGERTGFLRVAGVDGLESLAAGDGERAEQRARYQAYAQWFRTWPWLHRFVASVRHSPRLQVALYLFEVHRLNTLLTERPLEVDGTDAWFYFDSERDLAFALSAQIEGPDRLEAFVAGFDALESARSAWRALLADTLDETTGDEVDALVDGLEGVGTSDELEAFLDDFGLVSADRRAILTGDVGGLPLVDLPEVDLGADASADLVDAADDLNDHRSDVADAAAGLHADFGDRVGVIEADPQTGHGDAPTTFDLEIVYEELMAALPDRELRAANGGGA
ncbi:hypothetical protein GCM10025298_23790 [Natronobiforma cellulositropha]